MSPGTVGFHDCRLYHKRLQATGIGLQDLVIPWTDLAAFVWHPVIVEGPWMGLAKNP
jgi:hypothetical protein